MTGPPETFEERLAAPDRERLPRPRSGLVLVLLLLPGLLLVDIANGVLGEGQPLPGLPLTPGELVRGILFVVAVAITFRRRGVLYDQLRRAFFVLGALSLLGPAYGFIHSRSMDGLLFDLNDTVKILYGPAFIILFVDIYRRYDVRLGDLFDAMALFVATAGTALIYFSLVGLGEATYGPWAAAHKGFFIAQNDLGLAMVMGLVATSDGLLRGRGMRYILATVIAIGGMMVLGTRTATLGALAAPLLAVIFRVADRFTWRRMPLALATGGLLTAIVVGVGAVELPQITSQSYQNKKYQSLLQGQLTRVVLLGGALSYVSSRPRITDVLGEGSDRYETGVARQLNLRGDHKIAEVDWVDLLGEHGVVFMLALYFFYVRYFLLRIHTLAPRYRRELRWTFYAVLGIYLLHGTLAGHALADPIPMGIMALVAACVWVKAVALEQARAADAAH